MSLRNNQFYLFANWKMYLDYDESNILANALAKEAKKFPAKVKMVVFPSALSFYTVRQVLSDVHIGVGAQNFYWVDKGGYTGEISVGMYKSAGAQYALVGHSERRHLFHESNHDTAKKMDAILAEGLAPVLCLGETAEERAAGKSEKTVYEQLMSVFEVLSWPKEKEVVVAYEPVWAIGTGEACNPAEAERMQAGITRYLEKFVSADKIAVLYGGSVRPNNVSDYLSQPHIGGILAGGASANLESWIGIIKEAVK